MSANDEHTVAAAVQSGCCNQHVGCHCEYEGPQPVQHELTESAPPTQHDAPASTSGHIT